MRSEAQITIDGVALTERQTWMVRNAVIGLNEQAKHILSIGSNPKPMAEEVQRLADEVLALMPDRAGEPLG